VQKINYQALTEKAPKSRSGARWTAKGVFIVLVGLPVGFLLFIILMLVAPILMGLVAVGLFFWLIVYASRRNQVFMQQLQQFAHANNWQTEQVAAPLVPAFKRLGYRSMPAMVSGEIDSRPFWLYQCAPPVVQTQNDNYADVYMLSVEFPKQLPTLLLVPGAGMLGKLYDTIARSDFNLQPLRLEGNFNERVRSYAEKGAHISALEYLTPDVMAVVQDGIDDIALYSGNYMSVCVNVLGDSRVVKGMFEDAQLLIKELKEKAHIL
jgi:hypothetical protein